MSTTLDRAEHESDLEDARAIALSLKGQLDRARDEMQRIVWAMVITHGGTMRIHNRLLCTDGGRLTKTYDPSDDCTVLKADMGIGKDLTK